MVDVSQKKYTKYPLYFPPNFLNAEKSVVFNGITSYDFLTEHFDVKIKLKMRHARINCSH